MNVQEKEKQQVIINSLISGIEFATKQAVTAKDDFRAKFQKLNSEGTKTYSVEYVEKEMEKLKADILAKMQVVNTDMSERLENLRKLIHDRDTVLDLSNPALSNALALIQSIGSDLSFEEAVKINANFIHDQSGLKALKAAYKAHGVLVPGNVDEMIYDLDSQIDNLQKLAFQCFVQDGSINFFATAFAKFAFYEGLTTEKTPDQIGANDALRAAAGL